MDTTARTTPQNAWHDATRSLVGGLAVASGLFFFVAALQPTGLDPPPETVALFVVATTAATVSYLLVEGDGEGTVGYVAAMLTGAYVLVAVGLVLVGTYGPAGPRTNPVGPVAYVALAVAVILASIRGWQAERSTTETTRATTRAERSP